MLLAIELVTWAYPRLTWHRIANTLQPLVEPVETSSGTEGFDKLNQR